MNTVYIVRAETGSYDERHYKILGVFSSMEKAETYRKKITAKPSLPDNIRDLYSQFVHDFATKYFIEDKLRIELAEKKLNEILAERDKIKSQLEKAIAENDPKKIKNYSERLATFGHSSEKVHRMTIEKGQISFQECLDRAWTYDYWLRVNYSAEYEFHDIFIEEYKIDENA